MKGLILCPKVDRTQAAEEYLDENYFRLLAQRFKRANRHMEINIEDFVEDDSAEFLSDIEKPAYQGLDLFVYIGHGGRRNLYSAGISEASDAPQLAEKLTAACNDGAVIIFYACNAGKLNDSLLRTIYLSTLDKGFVLYGHSSAGRAGNNPDKTVFPPANGAMLIDECLGELAQAHRFRNAWNYAMGNEADDLWATFFSMSYDELLRRACRSVLRRAVAANAIHMNSLGWKSRLDDIRTLLGLDNTEDVGLAIGIARWQFRNFSNKREVDGILGQNSWRRMQQRL